MIKTLSKVGTEGTHLNVIKAPYEKPTVNITLSWQKLSVSLKIRNQTETSTFTTLIQYSTGRPGHSNQLKRRKKKHPNWKGGNKTVIIHR